MDFGLFLKIQLLVVLFSFSRKVDGKTCTKEFLHKYTIYKFNTYTHRLIPEEKIRKSIIIVCCEGYREISRNRIQPSCEPICNKSCGYGYCYGPNLCACFYGFEVSDEGVCERSIVAEKVVTKSIPEESSTIEQSTKQPLNGDLFFKKHRLIPYESYGFETTMPTSTKPTSFGYVFSTMWTKEKPSLKINEELHTIKTLPNELSELETTIQTSTPNSRSNMESSLKNIQNKVLSYKDVIFETTLQKHTPRELSKTDSTTLPFDPKPFPQITDRFGRKLVLNSDEINDPTEVSEIQEQKFVDSKFFNKQKSSNSFESSSDVEKKSLNNFPSNRYLASCKWDLCTCPLGYELYEEKLCRPCSMGNQCHCRNGYVFDSEVFQCRPLCNGVLDGCIGGTCIGYNHCQCNNGSEKIGDDRFRCYVKEGEVLKQSSMDRRWYLMLLLIPVGTLIFLSFFFVMKRWRLAKTNRLKAQKMVFQEIRYINKDPYDEDKYHEANASKVEELGFSKKMIQRNGNVVVVTI